MSEEKNIKAFNYGYEMAKHDPNLANSIASSGQGEITSYFKEGIKQFNRELLIAKRNEKNRSKQKDQGKDQGR